MEIMLINAIINCEFEYECNLDWDALGKTSNEFVRHCSACKKDVELCIDQHSIDVGCAEGKYIAYPIYSDELIKRIEAYEAGEGGYPFQNIYMQLGMPKRK